MISIKVDKPLFILFQIFLIIGTITLGENHKNLFLFFYIISCCVCLLNMKYLLLIFYSSIWISIKLFFDVAGVVIRVSDIIFLFILLSFLINSFYLKTFKVKTPRWGDYPIVGFLLLCVFSLFTSLNKIGTVVEIIQILQLIFLYYILLSLIKDDSDIKIFMIVTIIFGIFDSFWVFNTIIESGIGRRYIGILHKTPDEIPYALLFLYLFYLTEKNIFSKLIKFILLLLLIVALFLTMGRGLIIISGIMFLLASTIYLGSQKQYFKIIISLFTISLLSYFLITSSQSASKRYGSIVKGGEHRDLRLYNYYSSYMIMKKYPLSGVGLGNDYKYLKQYLPDFSPEIVRKWGGDSPHNEFLHFGIQVGIVGIIFAVYFYSNLMYKSFRVLLLRENKIEITSIALFSSVVGITIWGLANDIVLAGNGSFVILLMVFVDMKLNQNNEIA